MPSPSHLMKSRHGVFYFRMRLPTYRMAFATEPAAGDVAPDALSGGLELRVSLKTTCKKRATYLAHKKWINLMQAYQPWEAEAELAFEKYKFGKELINKHNRLDPHDEFALQELGERLSLVELE